MYQTIVALIENLKTDRKRPTNNATFNLTLDLTIGCLEKLKAFY